MYACHRKKDPECYSLYLDNIIKDTYEIISIYSWNKCRRKKIQYVSSYYVLH